MRPRRPSSGSHGARKSCIKTVKLHHTNDTLEGSDRTSMRYSCTQHCGVDFIHAMTQRWETWKKIDSNAHDFSLTPSQYKTKKLINLYSIIQMYILLY